MYFKPKYLIVAVIILFCSCKNKDSGAALKGLYSFGPDAHIFKDCHTGHEYWVTDQSNQLELQYSQLIIDKPYVPVYVEVEGKKIKSTPNGKGSDYDSTIVVTKLVKITKEIPKDMCN